MKLVKVRDEDTGVISHTVLVFNSGKKIYLSHDETREIQQYVNSKITENKKRENNG
jgi:hypothetical protein